MLSDVVEILEENPGVAENAIVLDAPHWHEGVVGIVASRLVRRYLRPVVLSPFGTAWERFSPRSGGI